MKTKNIIVSKTIWGGILTAIFGAAGLADVEMLTDADLNTLLNAIGILIGFVLTVYGRIKARIPVDAGKVETNAGGASAIIVIFTLLFCATSSLYISGCATYQNMNPSQKKIANAVLRTALSIGWYELTRHEPGLRPYLAGMATLLDDLVDSPMGPIPGGEDRIIRGYIETQVPDPFYRELLLQQIIESLSIARELRREKQIDVGDAEIMRAVAASIRSGLITYDEREF